MAEQEICDLLDDGSIERVTGNAVKGKEGSDVGYVESGWYIRECSYDTGVPSMTTMLSITQSNERDLEVLNGIFTDLVAPGKPVGNYQKVPGLGTLAGYGPDPNLPESFNTWHLGVVFTAKGERLLLTILIHGQHLQPDQVTPLAEELLRNLDSHL